MHVEHVTAIVGLARFDADVHVEDSLARLVKLLYALADLFFERFGATHAAIGDLEGNGCRRFSLLHAFPYCSRVQPNLTHTILNSCSPSCWACYPVGRMSRDDNRLFCEIVAVLLISDAQVTDEERRFLERLMDRFGFEDADRQAVFNSVNIGESVDGRLRQLPAARRVELLGELEAAAAADGEIGRGEQEILDEVRQALGREV